MKLAVVVQRYGAGVSGGAELHARYLAEHLSRHATIEVLTTCARDYFTWKNEWPAGEESVNGVKVRRFPVSRQRTLNDFSRRSLHVFDEQHSVNDELAWLESEGPASPKLIRHIRRVKDEFDFFIFFSARYHQAWHGARAVPGKAVLVPTAERDPALALSIFAPVFRSARAIMYNSPEERALIEAVSGRKGAGTIVGIGSEIPERTQPWRARKKFNLKKSFAIYIGRIDENKGCGDLFKYFPAYAERHPNGMDLVLVGSKHIEIPSHPRIRHLGFLEDEDKFDLLAASDVLVMPSPYESLSMVTIEAWALGKPVLVNGHCDVLRGQVRRSNAGLYYETVDEFVEGLYALEATAPASSVLGRHGREYVKRHYAWPTIERKYLDMLQQLQKESSSPALEPLPGYFERRRASVPPARELLAKLPSGPILR